MVTNYVWLATLGALSAVLLSGCGDSNSDRAIDPSDAPTVQVSEDTQYLESHTPSPTPADEADGGLGPVKSSVDLILTGNGGYQANLSLRWHKRVRVSYEDLIRYCDPNLLGNPDGMAMRMSVLEGTVTFPPVNGLSMPEAPVVSVGTYGFGPRCGLTESSNMNELGLNAGGGDPSTPQPIRVAFYEVGEKTPDNPDGDFSHVQPANFVTIQSMANHHVTCEPDCTFNY